MHFGVARRGEFVFVGGEVANQAFQFGAETFLGYSRLLSRHWGGL